MRKVKHKSLSDFLRVTTLVSDGPEHLGLAQVCQVSLVWWCQFPKWVCRNGASFHREGKRVHVGSPDLRGQKVVGVVGSWKIRQRTRQS